MGSEAGYPESAFSLASHTVWIRLLGVRLLYLFMSSGLIGLLPHGLSLSNERLRRLTIPVQVISLLPTCIKFLPEMALLTPSEYLSYRSCFSYIHTPSPSSLPSPPPPPLPSFSPPPPNLI